MAISAFNTNMFRPIFGRLSTGFLFVALSKTIPHREIPLPTVIEYCYRGEVIHNMFFDIDHMPQFCCFLHLSTTKLF